MKRLGIISLFVILFIAFIAVWNYSYQTGLEEAYISLEPNNESLVIPSETGVFQRSQYALDYANIPIDRNHQRTLDNYYKNRAFPGAPPSIPHDVIDELSMGDNSCLKCHSNGGFVEKFNAYTPVTPHPELVNCRQCHVPEQTNSVFKQNSFEKKRVLGAGNNNAMPGSPPVIPHQLQLRENCLACHAGPSAPREIRVSHPERVNCRQCHVPSEVKIEDIKSFTRNIKE